jgi:hypothetical protein
MKTAHFRSLNEIGTAINNSFQEESRAIARLSNSLVRHIVPLFIERRGSKPQLVGSSFLVSSRTRYYLVSAAHVFDELKAGHELFFYIEPKTKRKLSGNLRLTKTPPGKGRESDHLDVGVLMLEGPALPPYPMVQKYPLPITEFLPKALPRDGKQFLLVGFPESKSRVNPVARDLTSEPCSFRNVSAPASKYFELNVTPQTHIVLCFDVKHTVLPNGDVRAFPKPSGMSGSPIWLLYDPPKTTGALQASVVGIAIEHHKNKHAIVATDIDIALRLIDEAV